MTPVSEAQKIRKWQEEVARDPGSAAFLPLADTYRREGRLDVARRLCLRGLERHPEHVEAHTLLARIYREQGDLDRAHDELDIALSLDPAHGVARRAIGYVCLERRDWAGAVRHLETAAERNPTDGRLASALALARRHSRAKPSAGDQKEEAIARAFGAALDHFIREARVRLVLLIEGSGRIVAQRGFPATLDLAAFATLGAGIQSASQALAGLLGQPGFEQLYQGAGDRQLFLAPLASPVGELILLTSFGEETTVGLVRVHFAELSRTLGDLDMGPGIRRIDGAALEQELAAGLDRALGSGPRASS
jgi:tetratricopeptide (TPR) repeat protein